MCVIQCANTEQLHKEIKLVSVYLYKDPSQLVTVRAALIYNYLKLQFMKTYDASEIRTGMGLVCSVLND